MNSFHGRRTQAAKVLDVLLQRGASLSVVNSRKIPAFAVPFYSKKCDGAYELIQY